MLHDEEVTLEKSLEKINIKGLSKLFHVNVFGPMLLIKKLLPLIKKSQPIIFFLLLGVGNISDNRLGGWYSYRSSKSALNMMIKIPSIELQRMNKKIW